MIEELFIDLDGVMADFHKRYHEIFNEDAAIDYNVSNNKKAKKYRKNFHKFIEDKQFATLDPMPDFKEGIEFLEWINIEHKIPVCFLTSTAKEEYLNEISSQKKEWLKNNNIRFHAMFVPGKRFKCYFAKQNRILVDDTRSNVDSWNLHGGVGIHHESWEISINSIKDLL